MKSYLNQVLEGKVLQEQKHIEPKWGRHALKSPSPPIGWNKPDRHAPYTNATAIRVVSINRQGTIALLEVVQFMVEVRHPVATIDLGNLEIPRPLTKEQGIGVQDGTTAILGQSPYDFGYRPVPRTRSSLLLGIGLKCLEGVKGSGERRSAGIDMSLDTLVIPVWTTFPGNTRVQASGAITVAHCLPISEGEAASYESINSAYE